MDAINELRAMGAVRRVTFVPCDKQGFEISGHQVNHPDWPVPIGQALFFDGAAQVGVAYAHRAAQWLEDQNIAHQRILF